jgi:hypothetical protein
MKSEIPTIPYVAHDGDLGRRAVFHYVEQGNDRGRREIHVPHLVAGLVKHVAKRHRRYRCAFAETNQFGRRQGGEQVILPQLAGIDHDQIPFLRSLYSVNSSLAPMSAAEPTARDPVM